MKNEKLFRGYIFSKTRKNSIVTLVFALIFFALYLWYMTSTFIYFPNATSAGHVLDSQKFAQDTKMVTIESQTEEFDYFSAAEIVPPALLFEHTYKQGLNYRFKVQINNSENAGLAYTTSAEGTLSMLQYAPNVHHIPGNALYEIRILSIGGTKYAALVTPNIDTNRLDYVTHAVFTKLPLYVMHDLGLTEFADTEIGNWCLDLRGIPVDDEGTDFFLIIIFSILFPGFLAVAVMFLLKPQLHLNYLVIKRFGDVNDICADIEAELSTEGVYKEGRTVYTESYIIKETLYTTKVSKNHLKRS